MKRKYTILPILVGVLIVWYTREADTPAVPASPATPVETDASTSEIPAEVNRTDCPADLEIPARLYDREEQIIRHTGFTLSYNDAWRIPNWVGYVLTRDELDGNEERSNKFVPDPLVVGVETHTKDYSHSGYDRGHMAPAADMKWSAKAMRESFYLSNICPQLHNLNAGDWKELEDRGRDWARQDGAVVIVCGPIVGKKPARIGTNKIAVPDAFFKVILSPTVNRPRAIGFVMPQQKGNRPLRSYALTVDSVETLTGIDFFTALPDDVEQQLESTLDLSAWGL